MSWLIWYYLNCPAGFLTQFQQIFISFGQTSMDEVSTIEMSEKRYHVHQTFGLQIMSLSEPQFQLNQSSKYFHPNILIPK